MKKTLFTVVICLIGIFSMNAQVTFMPGFRGGVNFSHFSNRNDAYYSDFTSENNRSFNSITDFYIGFIGDLKLTRFYSLQPEVTYSRQGSEMTKYEDNLMRDVTQKLQVSYMVFSISNKFTFNDFNIHLGPTIEFLVEDNFNTDAGVDLAFYLGAGYDFTPNFGVEGRVKKGLIPVLDYSDGNHTNVVLSVGCFYKFDVK